MNTIDSIHCPRGIFFTVWIHFITFCLFQSIIFAVADALEHFENVTRSGHRSIVTAGIWATYPQDHVSNVTGFFDQVVT